MALKLSFNAFFFALGGILTEPFYKDGLHFSCQRCSHCCRHEPGYVYLSQDELNNLCKRYNLSSQEFIKQYCRWVPYYDGSEVLCLQEKDNYDCILWDGMCTAYEARPAQCSTYPFWPFIVESDISWSAEAGECPGINKGELHSKEEIELCIKKYSASNPIRKDRKE